MRHMKTSLKMLFPGNRHQYTLIFYFLSERESERLLSTVAAKTLLRMDIPVNNIKSAINNFNLHKGS
jgi:hypothetical protein